MFLRKNNLLVIAVIAATLAAVALSIFKHRDSKTYATDQNGQPFSTEIPSESENLIHLADIHLTDKNKEPPFHSSKHPFPNIPRTRTGMSLEDDPFNAESIQEQLWLDRHGYPNKQQWETYSKASDYLLQAASDSGDVAAKTMLNARKLPNKSAVDNLLLSAADGNDFALQLLAGYYAHLGPSKYIDAYTIARTSEMRGNGSAAMAREMLFRSPLTVEQRMRGEEGALMLNSTLNRLYKEKHGIDFVVDMRPTNITRKGNL